MSVAIAPDWVLDGALSRNGGKRVGERAQSRPVDWLARLEPGKPRKATRKAVEAVSFPAGAAHQKMLRVVGDLVKRANSGEPGIAALLETTRARYIDGRPDRRPEWDAALAGSIRLQGSPPVTIESPRQEKAPKGKLLRVGDLMGVEFRPLGWVVIDVVPEGTCLLVAAPKIGKSLLALDIAVACATGQDAFGTIPTGDPRPVLYLDLESGERRLQARVRAQGWDDVGDLRAHLDAANAVEVAKRFMRKHAGKRPLVILDTLAAVMTDRGDRATLLKHEYDSLKQFQELTARDPGSAILIVHHTRKLDSADPLGMASGTHGTTGAVDHVLVLSRADRMRTDGVLARISRDVEDAEFELQLRDARWHMVGASAADAQKAHEERERERRLAKLGPLKRALLDIVGSASGALLSVDTIADRYEGASDRKAIRQALSRLAADGLIERVGHGAYMTPMVTQ